MEGLPCAGKSATGRFIAETLGLRCVDEGSGNHPADYEFHAWLARDELGGFPEAEQQAILAAAAPACGGLVVPLARFGGALFERLLAHKIYDFLPWEVEKPVMLDKWRTFVAGVGPDEGWVFNCVLLQNPMCETMMRFGFDADVSAAYIGEICRIIQPLRPLVVYLRRDDIRAAIEAALPERRPVGVAGRRRRLSLRGGVRPGTGSPRLRWLHRRPGGAPAPGAGNPARPAPGIPGTGQSRSGLGRRPADARDPAAKGGLTDAENRNRAADPAAADPRRRGGCVRMGRRSAGQPLHALRALHQRRRGRGLDPADRARGLRVRLRARRDGAR